jgi:hypothetical protein
MSEQHFCRACRVKTKIVGDKVYLMNVELVSRSQTDQRCAPPNRGLEIRGGRSVRVSGT